MQPAETLAKENQDFRLESTVVSLQPGEEEKEIILSIVDDSEPEGVEVFFIYLSDPEGGAQITDSLYQGFGAFVKITILGKIQFFFFFFLISVVFSTSNQTVRSVCQS